MYNICNRIISVILRKNRPAGTDENGKRLHTVPGMALCRGTGRNKELAVLKVVGNEK
jgi:hypothetical protein